MTAFKQLADSQQRSGRQDLNLRPLAPQASAYSRLRHAPNQVARLAPATGAEVSHVAACVAIGPHRERNTKQGRKT